MTASDDSAAEFEAMLAAFRQIFQDAAPLKDAKVWILKDKTPELVDLPTGLAWQAAYPEACRVAYDTVGDVTISTVFLSTMAFSGDFLHHSAPFETLVTNISTGKVVALTRAKTWEEAEAAHHEAVQSFSHTGFQLN